MYTYVISVLGVLSARREKGLVDHGVCFTSPEQEEAVEEEEEDGGAEPEPEGEAETEEAKAEGTAQGERMRSWGGILRSHTTGAC